MSKKIISLALVVMMLAAFIPATLFTAGAEGEAGYQFRIAFGLDGAHAVEGVGAPSKSYGGKTIEYKANVKTVTHYAMTDGMWKYFASSGLDDSWGGMLDLGVQYQVNGYVALKVNIPATSTYDVTFTSRNSNTNLDIVLLPGTTAAGQITTALSGEDAIPLFKGLTNSGVDKKIITEGVEIEKGEYVLVFKSGSAIWPKYIDFKTSGATEFTPTVVGFVEDVALEEGETAEAKSWIFNVDDKTQITEGISYAITDTSVATVEGTTVTPVGGGNTTITATVADRVGNIIPGNVQAKKEGNRFKYSFASVNMINPTTGAPYTGGYARPEKVLTYNDSMGMWKYHSNYALSGSDGHIVGGTLMYLGEYKGAFVAYTVKVPASGTYYVDITTNGASAAVNYFLRPVGTTLNWTIMEGAYNLPGTIVLFDRHSATGAETQRAPAPVTLEKGEYYLVLNESNTANTTIRIKEIVFTEVGATSYKNSYVGTVDNIAEELEVGDEADITAKVYDSYAITEYTGDVVYSSSDDKVVKVEGTKLKAVGGGTAKITAIVEGKDTLIDAGTVSVAVPEVRGYRFKYSFSRGDITSIPEIGAVPSKYDAALGMDVEYTYCMKTIDYPMTQGTWKYHTNHGVSKYGGMTDDYTQITPTGADSASTNYMALKINVPVSGTFDLNFKLGETTQSNFYLLPGNTPASEVGNVLASGEGKTVLFEGFGTGKLETGKYITKTVEGVTLEKGEYILVMQTGSWGAIRPCYLEVVSSGANVFDPVYVGAVDPINMLDNGTAAANARVYDAYTHEAVADSSVAFAISGSAATLSDKTVTAVKDGYATLSATSNMANIVPATVTVANKALTDAFTVSKTTDAFNAEAPTAVAYVKGAGEIDVEIGVTANGNKYTLSAPEEVEDYTFLYWANGLTTVKKILGFDAEALSYIPQNGANIVIAVYDVADDEEAKKAEFYAGNGDLVAVLEENGEAPELPYMPGYVATEWMNVARETLDAGDEVTLEEGVTEIWVAQYEKADDIVITAVNATGAGTYAYGDLVTLEANGSGTFRYWKKTLGNDEEEIVGFAGKKYSFYAWEDCTVEAVYGDAAPVYKGGAQKILIDTFGTNSVMAEFIGFGGFNILEKGINVNGTNFAMTTGNMQFTLTDIAAGADVKGYVIYKDSTGTYKITDGE